MIKCIVTTTINSPTAAIYKYAAKKDWTFIIVGDLKTPHEHYYELEKQFPNVMYLDPNYQEEKYTTISDLIGWNTVERRNIGFIQAYKMGCQVMATIDDDNIPYDFWGENLLVGKNVIADLWIPELNVFDPLSVTNCKHLWHRGYPIEYLPKRHLVHYRGQVNRKVLIQADLWDGDPDIDAICRMTHHPIVKFDDIKPFCSTNISPFNSQNVFIAREVIPYYTSLPFIGRMSDIWSSYIVQNLFPNSLVYNKASVYQQRNDHDLTIDLENEMLGYKHTLEIVNDLDHYQKYLPEKTNEFYELYKMYFTS